MSFTVDITAFVIKVGLTKDLVCRKIAMDMFKEIVEATPVDKGMAINNWLPSLDTPATGTIDTPDKTGTGSLNKARAVVAQWNANDNSIFLVNNLPYIQTLENGSSKQAPAGMVTIAIARFEALVAEASR